MEEKKESCCFEDWFKTNLIYCEDTHSFVHRCFDAFKKCNDYKEAQEEAFIIMGQMIHEYHQKDPGYSFEMKHYKKRGRKQKEGIQCPLA